MNALTDVLLLVLAGVALAGYWPMSRKIRDWQIEASREAERADRADERAKGWRECAESLKAHNRRDRARALARIESLRSQNERLRLWQWRVINGSVTAERHLAEYAREMTDDAQGGEPS